MADTQQVLRKTPLHTLHLELGGKMVPFAGYEMPVQYPAGVLKEHLHTRASAGLFDVSHMGQAFLSGPDPARALERVTPADVIGLKEGMQRYGLLLTEQGTRVRSISSSMLAPRKVTSHTSARSCAGSRRLGRNKTARCSRCRGRKRVRCWSATRRESISSLS